MGCLFLFGAESASHHMLSSLLSSPLSSIITVWHFIIIFSQALEARDETHCKPTMHAIHQRTSYTIQHKLGQALVRTAHANTSSESTRVLLCLAHLRNTETERLRASIEDAICVRVKSIWLAHVSNQRAYSAG